MIMLAGLKIAALYGVPAAAVVIAIESVLFSLQNAAVPIGDVIGGGATGGAIVGAVAWALYKAKVDQHACDIKELKDTKADKELVSVLDRRLSDVHTDVREIRNILTKHHDT